MNLNSIFSKLLLGFIPLIFVMLVVSNFLGYYSARQIIQSKVLDNLTGIAERNVENINHYILERHSEIRALARYTYSDEAVAYMKGDSILDLGSLYLLFGKELEDIAATFENIDYQNSFTDFYLVATSGKVLFSSDIALIGINVTENEEYAGTGLAVSVGLTDFVIETVISQAEDLPSAEGEQAIFLSTPILRDGRPVAILAAKINSEDIYDIVGDRAGMGETGEVLIVQRRGDNARYVSPLKYENQLQHNKESAVTNFSIPVQQALSGESRSGIFPDYRGVDSLAIGRLIPSLSWVILTKMDEAEAFSDVDSLQNTILLYIALAVMLSGLVSYLISQKITTPIDALTTVAARYTNGDQSARVKIDSKGELGGLAHTFNSMLEKQQEHRLEIDKYVKSLESQATELHRSNIELDGFAYVASHDLKSPLRGIDQLANIIEEDIEEGDFALIPDHMKLMHSRISRMELLLSDLLEYSRVGRVEDKIKTVVTNDLVLEIFDVVNVDNKFSLEIVGEAPEMETLAAPFETVMRNLIGNAVKHNTKEVGKISVIFREDEEFFHITVRDDGDGIDPEFHQRIFGMFQTLKSRDEVEGSGLGLAMVRKIVELRGGHIVVESAVGEGASFTFNWPITIQK